MTKSHVPTVNAPVRIDVQEGHNQVTTESRQRLKRGRPIGSKDKNPRKQKKGAENDKQIRGRGNNPINENKAGRL